MPRNNNNNGSNNNGSNRNNGSEQSVISYDPEVWSHTKGLIIHKEDEPDTVITFDSILPKSRIFEPNDSELVDGMIIYWDTYKLTVSRAENDDENDNDIAYLVNISDDDNNIIHSSGYILLDEFIKWKDILKPGVEASGGKVVYTSFSSINHNNNNIPINLNGGRRRRVRKTKKRRFSKKKKTHRRRR